MGDPNFIYGGIVYHLGPALRASQEKINEWFPRKKNELINQNAKQVLGQVIEQSLRIVLSTALKSRSFFAIGFAFQEGREVAIQRYQKLAKESPEFFQDPLAELIEYFKVTDEVLGAAFSGAPKSESETETLVDFSIEALCKDFKEGNLKSLQLKIDFLRTDLSEKRAPLQKLRERASLLKKLPQSLQNCQK